MDLILVKTDGTCKSMSELQKTGVIVEARTRVNRCNPSSAYAVRPEDLEKALSCKGVTCVTDRNVKYYRK